MGPVSVDQEHPALELAERERERNATVQLCEREDIKLIISKGGQAVTQLWNGKVLNVNIP